MELYLEQKNALEQYFSRGHVCITDEVNDHAIEDVIGKNISRLCFTNASPGYIYMDRLYKPVVRHFENRIYW